MTELPNNRVHGLGRMVVTTVSSVVGMFRELERELFFFFPLSLESTVVPVTSELGQLVHAPVAQKLMVGPRRDTNQ